MICQVNLALNSGVNRIPPREAKHSIVSEEDRFIPARAHQFPGNVIMASVTSGSSGISLDKAAEGLFKKPEPPPPPFTEVWGIRYDELSYCSSSCLGPDGSLHFKTSGGTLISVKEGKVLQTLQVNSGCDPSIACGPDGTLYTGTVWVDHSTYDWRGSIVAIKDGKKLWDFNAHDAIRRPAVIGLDGSIYVGDDSGYLYSLKYESRLGGLLKGARKQWSMKMSGGLCAPLSIGPDGTLYMATSPQRTYDEQVNRLHAVKNGKELWNVRLDKAIYTKPAIGPDGTVYVRCEDKKLYAIKDGKLAWDCPAGFSTAHDLCIGPDGTICFGDDERKLVAVKDGKRLWDFKPGDWGSFEATPCWGKDGTVYAGSRTGILYAVKDGKEQWAVNVNGGGIQDLFLNEKSDILHITTHNGSVIALRINDTAGNDVPPSALDIMNSGNDGKATGDKPGIDESSLDGWVIVGGVKIPKKNS